MGVFAGVNATADNGIVKSVSATKVKTQVMGSGNQNCSGVTFFIDYTKGPESSATFTATMISPVIAHATNEYQVPLVPYGSISGLSITLTATGKWVWPVAVPALAELYIVLTLSSSGSAKDDTTVVTIDAARDTLYGS